MFIWFCPIDICSPLETEYCLIKFNVLCASSAIKWVSWDLNVSINSLLPVLSAFRNSNIISSLARIISAFALFPGLVESKYSTFNPNSLKYSTYLSFPNSAIPPPCVNNTTLPNPPVIFLANAADKGIIIAVLPLPARTL